MPPPQTPNGVVYDPVALDATEKRFWADIWDSVPDEAARRHGIERREFGPVQATVVDDLAGVGMINLVLGGAEAGADDLAAACDWALARGISPYVPITPGLPGSDAAEAWLLGAGFERGYGWMKFVRDVHPPRFKAPEVEVVEIHGKEEPFAMIAATGFGMPAWAAAFYAGLPALDNWRCYVARVDGIAQACAAMVVHGDVAELGIAATLEPARGRGCQLALLHRRILDAAEAGCETLLIETGERVEGRPAISYRNILRAGFEEAYARPNWQFPRGASRPARDPA